MSLGNKLYSLRKKATLSQEEVAEKLSVSRQTISKWETDQSIPELTKVKELCKLYNISYEYLINDEQQINHSNINETSDNIDWTLAWSKKYPILTEYQKIENIEKYQDKISELYDSFKKEFELSNQDTILILKDILYKEFLKNK